jgi:hypothetical protein
MATYSARALTYIFSELHWIQTTKPADSNYVYSQEKLLNIQ